MKKAIVVLAFVLLCAMVVSAVAEMKMEIGESGRVYFTTTQGEPRRSLTPIEEQAVKSPGEEIPVDPYYTVERNAFSWSGFFFITPVQKYSRVAVYDPGKETVIMADKEGKIYDKKSLLVWRVVFLVVAIVVMVVSNIQYARKGKNVAAAAVFAAIIAMGSVVTITTVTIVVVATSIAVIAAGAVAIAESQDMDNKWYIIFSVMFYVAVVITMFV